MLAMVGACGPWRTGRGLLIALALSVGTPAGFAAELETTAPGAAEPPDPGTSIEPEQAEPDEAEAPEPKLLGDLGGLRPALDKYGISLDLGYIGETFGVVHGGVKRGAIYEGQASAELSFDLEKMFGWPGAKINANALQIHGRGASRGLPRRQSGDGQQYRGAADDPALPAVFRAESVQRSRLDPARADRRRRRIHHQRDRRRADQRHVRLAGAGPRPIPAAAARPIRCRSPACGCRSSRLPTLLCAPPRSATIRAARTVRAATRRNATRTGSCSRSAAAHCGSREAAYDAQQRQEGCRAAGNLQARLLARDRGFSEPAHRRARPPRQLGCVCGRRSDGVATARQRRAGAQLLSRASAARPPTAISSHSMPMPGSACARRFSAGPTMS